MRSIVVFFANEMNSQDPLPSVLAIHDELVFESNAFSHGSHLFRDDDEEQPFTAVPPQVPYVGGENGPPGLYPIQIGVTGPQVYSVLAAGGAVPEGQMNRGYSGVLG